MIVNTIADLVALSTIPSDNHVHVLGYNTPADGGGGDFYWDAASLDTDNGGTVFESPSIATGPTNPGRWLRAYSESINLKWFGAVGDGTTNDSPAFQKMIDYCEPAGIKDVVIPFGKFYLAESVYVRIGGIKFIGQGCLLREDSWYSGGSARILQPYDAYFYNGSILLVKKGISGIVYDTAVSDSVYWRGVGFIAEEGRTIGNTYAIDFRSIFTGPTWPFNVHECYFACFNRVFNFTGTGTTYNIASIDITHCAFSSNDEVIYQGFQAGTDDRYTCWGVNFCNNKAHMNSRVIYGCFGKDLVTISDNNLEGNIAYADGTSPTYSVDLEIYNCSVIFHGNHFEGMECDCVSISSMLKNANGSYKSVYPGTAPYVDIYGNNFDGLNSGRKPFTLTGCIIRMNESDNGYGIPIYVHECEILDNSRSPIYLTDYAKENGTIIKFTDSESLSAGFINSVNSYGTALYNNSKGFLKDDEQWVRTTRSGFGAGSGHAFNGDVKYCIATFKMKNTSAYTPASSANFFLTKDGTSLGTFGVYGSLFPPLGESIAVCILPSDGLFTDTSDNSFSVGLNSIYNTEDTVEMEFSASVFMYTTKAEDPRILPIFEPTNVVDESNGTFIKGQTYFNGTKYRIVTESGTMVTNYYWSPTAYVVTNVSGNKIELNGTYEFFTQGQYIDIAGVTYRIIELRNLWATLDIAPPASIVGEYITFHAPTFSTLINDDNVSDYAILNQNASAQAANGWIDGDFTADGRVTAGAYQMPDGSIMAGDNTSWGFYNSGTGALPVKVGSLTVSDDYVNNAPANGIFSKGTIMSGVSVPGTVGINLTTNDAYAEMRVIRNSLNASDKDMYIGYDSGATSSLHLYSNNVETITVTGGNAGIGTASPAQKLDVSGTIRQSTATSAMLKANSSGDIVAATAGTDYVAPGFLESGTYTPTVTPISGLTDTYTVETFTYTRIGDVVHVAGTVKITPASYASLLRTMYVTLPLASTVGEYNVAGVGNGRNNSDQIIQGATVCGDAVNNTAEVTYEAASSVKLYLQFDYTIQ